MYGQNKIKWNSNMVLSIQLMPLKVWGASTFFGIGLSLRNMPITDQWTWIFCLKSQKLFKCMEFFSYLYVKTPMDKILVQDSHLNLLNAFACHHNIFFYCWIVEVICLALKMPICYQARGLIAVVYILFLCFSIKIFLNENSWIVTLKTFQWYR